MGDMRTGTVAFAMGCIVALPLGAAGTAQANGTVDYQGPFSGNVDSGGYIARFGTVRCDSDGTSVNVGMDAFTSSTGRTMSFRAIYSTTPDFQTGAQWIHIAVGESADMNLPSHCWRFAAYVDPGRDLTPGVNGDGTVTFDGQLKY